MEASAWWDIWPPDRVHLARDMCDLPTWPSELWPPRGTRAAGYAPRSVGLNARKACLRLAFAGRSATQKNRAPRRMKCLYEC